MFEVLPILLAYLLGAIPFGILISKIAGIENIRKIGSGNIGATNVWRAVGFKYAVWVFVGDIGKGAIAVWLAKYYVANYQLNLLAPDLFFVICAVVAVIGHIFPVYLGFKGGKGVNTTLGALLVLLPIETLICVGIFIVTVLIFRYISLGSIIGTLTMLIVIVLENNYFQKEISPIYLYLSIILSVTIIATHYQNISRLLKGTENKFSFSSKTKTGGSHV